MRSRAAAVVAVLLVGSASADPAPACRREPDGRVSCDAESFGLLTRATLEARGRADECSAQLGGVRDQLAARDRDLAACEAEPEPEPAPKPAGASTSQVVGFALGVIGATIVGVASNAIARDGLVSATPVLVSALGAGGVIFGAVLLSW